jgi:ATP-binding cassette subfamily B protein
MRLVVASGNEERERTKFRLLNSAFVQSLLSIQVLSFMASALPATVLALSTAIVFLYGGSLVIHGLLTTGQLVAFMAYHLRLLSPVQSLLGIYTNLLTGGVALGRVFELLDVPVEVKESRNPQSLAAVRGDVTFDRVKFRYSEGTPVLEEVSLHVPAGSLCAIVGPSGAGKSTIGELLLRFYDPDSGVISIDGCDLRSVKLQDLRRHVALVEQSPHLFRATVQENIAYGKPGAPLGEIRACARAAAIDDFIQSLPAGYDTIIGERGCTISAGERQRIALARALLRNPSILIMDEPTSALDPTSEAAIVRTLAETLRGRTVILMTHRLSLVEIVDLVAVLEGGSIIEFGNPRKLLSGDTQLSRQFRLVQAQMTASA